MTDRAGEHFREDISYLSKEDYDRAIEKYSEVIKIDNDINNINKTKKRRQICLIMALIKNKLQNMQ